MPQILTNFALRINRPVDPGSSPWEQEELRVYPGADAIFLRLRCVAAASLRPAVTEHVHRTRQPDKKKTKKKVHLVRIELVTGCLHLTVVPLN